MDQGGARQADAGEPAKPSLTISQSPRGRGDEGDSNQAVSSPKADPVFQGKCAAELAAERIGLTVTRTRAPGSLSSWEHHQVMVTGLEPNGVAQKSELVHIGDEIVTVDGKAVYSLSLSEVVRQIEKTALEAGSSLLTLGLHRNSTYMLANLYRPLKRIEFEEDPSTESDDILRRSTTDVDFDYRSPNGRQNTPRKHTEKDSTVGRDTETRVRRRPLFDIQKDEKLRRIFVCEVSTEFNEKVTEAVMVGDTLLAIDGAYLRWDEVDTAKRLIFGDLEEPGEEKTISLSFLRKAKDDKGILCPRAFSISVSSKSCVKEMLYKPPLQHVSPPPPKSEHQGKDFWLSQEKEAEQPQKAAEQLQKAADPPQEAAQAPKPIGTDAFLRASSTSDEWMEEDEWLKMLQENQGRPPFLTSTASIHVSVQSVKNLPKGLEKSHNLSCQLSLGGRTEKTTPNDDIRFSQCNVNCVFHSSKPSSDQLVIQILDLSSPPNSPPIGSVNLLVDNLARWSRSPGNSSRCWFRLRAEDGKPVPGTDGPATLELCWEILKAENPLSTRDYALRDRSRSPPRMKAGPARSPQPASTAMQPVREQDAPGPAPNAQPPSHAQQLAGRVASTASRREEDRFAHANGVAQVRRLSGGAVEASAPQEQRSERRSAPAGASRSGMAIARSTSAADGESFMIALQKQLALTEERIVALEHEKHSDEATIQMHTRELQTRQEVLNSLTEQLKIVETDGKGTIVGHARSGAVLRELEDLLAAASTDGGAGEGFRMPSSAFLAQGCAEAMVMANLHRYIHARKQRTLKAEEALAGAERVISDQAAEIIGLKAQLRELTGKTPRRRKSLEGGEKEGERSRREERPAVTNLKADVATGTDDLPVGPGPARHTPRALLQEPVREPLAPTSQGSSSREEASWSGERRTREELEQDVKAACAQVEEQMVLISRLHARMDQAGIALPEDLMSARSIILPPSRKGTGTSQRLTTPRQIDTDAPQAPRSGGSGSQGLNTQAARDSAEARRRSSHTRLF